ncbi:MAG: hypothetical protein Q8M98_03100 [Candidatus Cloacimonadaceae bacterium]|nr:hypothetical protein [Candidatus Cloacimonadaceae bacterium]
MKDAYYKALQKAGIYRSSNLHKDIAFAFKQLGFAEFAKTDGFGCFVESIMFFAND